MPRSISNPVIQVQIAATEYTGWLKQKSHSEVVNRTVYNDDPFTL